MIKKDQVNCTKIAQKRSWPLSNQFGCRCFGGQRFGLCPFSTAPSLIGVPFPFIFLLTSANLAHYLGSRIWRPLLSNSPLWLIFSSYGLCCSQIARFCGFNSFFWAVQQKN
jgi:hypothetical protein